MLIKRIFILVYMYTAFSLGSLSTSGLAKMDCAHNLYSLYLHTSNWPCQKSTALTVCKVCTFIPHAYMPFTQEMLCHILLYKTDMPAGYHYHSSLVYIDAFWD